MHLSAAEEELASQEHLQAEDLYMATVERQTVQTAPAKSAPKKPAPGPVRRPGSPAAPARPPASQPAPKPPTSPTARPATAQATPAASKPASGTARQSVTRPRPWSMIVYGPPGVGKTEFAANAPSPGFIIDPQEQGIKSLIEFGSVPASVTKDSILHEPDNFKDLIAACDSIPREIETVVFDSLTGFEKLCFQHHCAEYFENDWSKEGFYAYQAGPKNAAKTDWPAYIDALNNILLSGKNVLLIAHSQVKAYSNPEGPDYDRFLPYLDKETWAATHRWANAVLYYGYRVIAEKQGPKAKANIEASEGRYIYTEWSPVCDAKNVWRLPPVIEAGNDGTEAFQAFSDALEKRRRGG